MRGHLFLPSKQQINDFLLSGPLIFDSLRASWPRYSIEYQRASLLPLLVLALAARAHRRCWLLDALCKYRNNTKLSPVCTAFASLVVSCFCCHKHKWDGVLTAKKIAQIISCVTCYQYHFISLRFHMEEDTISNKWSCSKTKICQGGVQFCQMA